MPSLNPWNRLSSEQPYTKESFACLTRNLSYALMPTVDLQFPGSMKSLIWIILLGEQCNNPFRGVWISHMWDMPLHCCESFCSSAFFENGRHPVQVREGGRDPRSRTIQNGCHSVVQLGCWFGGGTTRLTLRLGGPFYICWLDPTSISSVGLISFGCQCWKSQGPFTYIYNIYIYKYIYIIIILIILNNNNNNNNNND